MHDEPEGWGEHMHAAAEKIDAAMGGRVDKVEEPTAYALARGPHDEPVCASCMSGKALIACEVEDDPRYCKCPTCGTRYRTPVHRVLGHLAAMADAFGLTIRVQAGDTSAAEATEELHQIAKRYGLPE